MKKYFREDEDLIEEPLINEIFVFGSNREGIHGKGAAKVAFQKYGAKFGLGFGFYGNSYAIPTKHTPYESMNLNEIKVYIRKFVEYSLTYSHMDFYVTQIGCGLAGFRPIDIAPLFKECNNNCRFSEQWKKYLE